MARSVSPFAVYSREEWNHGLFDCCDDNGSRIKFLLNIFCPGYLSGNVAMNTVCPPPQCMVDGLFPCSAICCALYWLQPTLKCTAGGFAVAWLLDCFMVGRMRDTYNLKGHPLLDCLLLLYCFPCYATQVQREVTYRSPHAAHTAEVWDETFDKAKGTAVGAVKKSGKEQQGGTRASSVDYDDDFDAAAPRAPRPSSAPQSAPYGYEGAGANYDYAYPPPAPLTYSTHNVQGYGPPAYSAGPYGGPPVGYGYAPSMSGPYGRAPPVMQMGSY
eukprot:TRINITY_DN15158_c0_g1_i1.p1 TRINITY_DN15158_c0_g1~~TRINITY_DN15158_c0_g1_i1.p1  ORF type:complete len:272 (-),score=25.37 TRINITY_DN15158_c0_g1_i1:108-923(-)